MYQIRKLIINNQFGVFMRKATREIIRRAASVAGSQTQLAHEIDANLVTIRSWFKNGSNTCSTMLKAIEYATDGKITTSDIIDAIAHNQNMKIQRILDDKAGDYKTALEKAIKIAGSAGVLAQHLGVSSQAIHSWKVDLDSRVPKGRVIQVYIATGVTPHELRPDLYPNPNDGI